MVVPLSRKLFIFLQASRMATISPCAVGSLFYVTMLCPLPITFPSLTITAPNGPPLFKTLFLAKLIASYMYLCSSFLIQCFFTGVAFPFVFFTGVAFPFVFFTGVVFPFIFGWDLGSLPFFTFLTMVFCLPFRQVTFPFFLLGETSYIALGI